jgi:hypothetical protein
MFEADLGGERKQRFILLVQPCDIAVRNDGVRKFEEAILVEVIKEAPSGKGGAAPVVVEIPSFEGEGKEYIHFRCWGSVSLRCLDFAVFNSDGHVRFDVKMLDGIEKSLVPGWAVRLNDAKKALVPAPRPAAFEGETVSSEASSGAVAAAAPKIPNEYRLMSLSRSIPESEGRRGADGSLWFPYKRIGRLRDHRAVAAYAAFSSFQTRGAFEHDFSGLTDKKPKEGAGKPPEPKKSSKGEGKPSNQNPKKGSGEGKKQREDGRKPQDGEGGAKGAAE